MKHLLLPWALGVAVMSPFASAAQEDGCGSAAQTVLQVAYPAAEPVSEDKYSADEAAITLPDDQDVGLDPYVMVCRRWPANPQNLLVAVPLVREEQDDGVRGDLDILVLTGDTPEVLARLRIPDFISDDAIRLNRISFDTAPYRLVSGRIAFGVRASLEGSSRVNPFHETTLWLYDLDGRELKPILDNIVVEKSGGEWDGNCAGEFWATRRTLAVSEQMHHGAADLVVTTREESSRSEQRDGECQDSPATSATSTQRLAFDGRSYRVPESLKRAR